MKNERNLLESDRFETSSTLETKCDTFVVNFNKSPEIKKTVKKPTLKNEVSKQLLFLSFNSIKSI